MKKTVTTLALLASISFAAPAYAIDDGALGLGIGIGLGIVKKIAEGQKSKKRVRTREKSAAKNGVQQKDTATTATDTATTAATVAFVLPEIGPLPELRPDPATVAVVEVLPTLDAAPADTKPAPLVVADQGVMFDVIDELGRSWGKYDRETAQKIGQAQNMGMSRMDAIKLLTGRTEPLTMPYSTEPYKAPADIMTAEKPATVEKVEQPAAVAVVEPEKAAAVIVGRVGGDGPAGDKAVPSVVVEQTPAAVEEVKPEPAAKTADDAENVAVISAKDAEKAPIEVPAVAADNEIKPAIDEAKTASVEKEETALEAAPKVEEKPKRKLDIGF